MFINIKTEYNFSKSLCKIENLIKYSIENNIHQLGIVDEYYLISTGKFIDLCLLNNIKPIIGVSKKITQKENEEIKFLNNQQITIYATNNKGIEILNSFLQKEISLADLKKIYENKNDLRIVIDIYEIYTQKKLTNFIKFCEENKINNIHISYNEKLILLIEELKEEDYNILKLKNWLKNKIIYNEEIRYLNNKDLDAFLVLEAIRQKEKYTTIKKNMNYYKSLSLESKYDKVIKNKKIPPHILQNTQQFIENIDSYNLKTTFQKTLNFSEYQVINFKEKLNNLLTIFLENNHEKLNNPAEVYQKRLDYEYNIIEKMDFQNYFLIMEDIVTFCQNNQIPYGYGRGSSGGSLVSYLLKITKIDPIAYNLYFERFLNPKRSSLPDIDLDISDAYRQEVINYLINKYGETKVAKIGIISTYQTKSAFNEITKVLDYDKTFINNVSKHLTSQLTFEENIKKEAKFFSKYIFDAQFNFLQETLEIFEGLPKHISIHAAGIIISAENLAKIGSIYNNTIYTEAKYLEKNGYIKFDLLGLTTLNFIAKLEKEVIKIDPNYAYEEVELNNKYVYDNLSKAKTFGVFQLESKGIKKLLQRYKPDNLMDIAIMISLYRPGPMKNIDKYLENKNKYPNISYYHQDLKEVLESTYGILIFQEQIMEVVKIIANYLPQEADLFRIAMSKKDEKKIKNEKEKFIKQGLAKGYTKHLLEKLFADILEFAGYGFNKAHAVGYARLIYQIMYLKSKYPTIFYSEMFYNNINSTNKELFLMELYSNNIEIIPPSINNISLKNKLSRKQIILGLYNIKDISKNKIEEIYQNTLDYFTKIEDLKNFNLIDYLEEVIINSDLEEKAKKSLVYSGFFLEYEPNMKVMEKTLLKYNKIDLNILRGLNEKINLVQIEDYTFLEKSQLEKQSLKFNILYSSKKYLLQKLKKKYPNEKLIKLSYQLKDLEIFKEYFVYLKIFKIKVILTKNNKEMAFLVVKENTQEIEITCFEQEYQLYQQELQQTNQNYIFKIIKNKQNKLILKEIIK